MIEESKVAVAKPGALAFFPWFIVEQDLSVASYRLTRFERACMPGGAQQPTFDAVLEPYLEGEARPISRATLLTKEDRTHASELTEEDIRDLFEVSELVAFAGLAGRQYFGLGGKYGNRETYSLVIQRFSNPAGGVAITTRRRDGASNVFRTRGQYKVRRPESQGGVIMPPLDERLLAALIRTRDHGDYPRFAEAIYFFNQANTDRDGVTEESESISMVSAFERLLDCRRGKEDDLVVGFSQAWRPTRCLLPSACPHLPAPSGRSLGGTWIRDFFLHRGFHAHGRRLTQHAATWNLREHLLFGAYAFPLLLKQELTQRGLYELTEQDQMDVDSFEELLTVRHFAPLPEDEDMTKYPWDEIRGAMRWQRVTDRFLAAQVDTVKADASDGSA